MEEKARKKKIHTLPYLYIYIYIHTYTCMSLSFSCVGSIYNFVSSLYYPNKWNPYMVFTFEPNYLRRISFKKIVISFPLSSFWKGVTFCVVTNLYNAKFILYSSCRYIYIYILLINTQANRNTSDFISILINVINFEETEFYQES